MPAHPNKLLGKISYVRRRHPPKGGHRRIELGSERDVRRRGILANNEAFALAKGVLMANDKPEDVDRARQQQRALSTWDTEGGAGPLGPQEESITDQPRSRIPALTNAEVVQLRVRVIALENLVIALLAEASERQLDRAREMAVHVSPRPGFTHHPLTLHAAVQMNNLVERASHFRPASDETS